jgi:SAM-dependent methyltransferase
MSDERVSLSTRRAYDAAADRYHELFHDELAGKPHDRDLLDAFASGLDGPSLVLDAGCGPCGHVGRYLFDKGLSVTAVDISDRCAQLAARHNPGIPVRVADLSALPFRDRTFDGILSWYSIIDTPKCFVGRIFREFHRTLKPGGVLLVVVKAGTDEGWTRDLVGVATEIYVTHFTGKELARAFVDAGFQLARLETRAPYAQEIEVDRIYAIGRRAR